MNVKSREILFLARKVNYKMKENKKWLVEGIPIISDDQDTCLMVRNMSCSEDGDKKGLNFNGYRVDRDTLCQYIGRRDDKENRIWEYNIVKVKYAGLEHYFIVVYDEERNCFIAADDLEDWTQFVCLWDNRCENIEVVDHLFYHEDVESVLKELG